MSRPYDHTAFAKKLELLAAFQREHGHTNVPRDYPDKALVNWIAAQKQAFATGKLSQERTAQLTKIGFVFASARPRSQKRPASPSRGQNAAALKRGRALAQADAAFAASLEQLSHWLDEKENTSGRRNLTYRDTQASDAAKTAYGFVEQMALRAQQGHLTDTHRTRLMMLAFTVNGRTIDSFLPVQQASDVVHPATSHEGPQPSDQPPVYLTTDELARRLNYDPRTIREILKDRVLVENRHYVRPFGRRKILWIWEAIQTDIRAGLCAT